MAARATASGALLACDAAAVAVGLVLANHAAGLFLGVLPPLLGLGFGVALWAVTERGERPGWAAPRLPTFAVGALALLGAAAALALFLHDTFTWVEAEEGQRNLFGYTLEASRDRLPGLTGGWREDDNPKVPFSALLEQLAFGMFPWMALAPIALGALGLGLVARRQEPAAGAGVEAASGGESSNSTGGAPQPARWAGYALFAWAAAAWLVATILARKVGPVVYPAVVAIAVAIGVWLDRLLARRRGEDDPGSLPLVALFALFAALVLSRDLYSVPDELTSLTSAASVKYPEGSSLHKAVLAFGVLFGLAAALGLFLWRGPYRSSWRPLALVIDWVGRRGLHAAVAIGLCFGLFLSHLWVPGLSARMSSRDVLGRYRELGRVGDLLGLLGNLGSGPTYYAGSDYVKLGSRNELIEFLQRKERVFALTRTAELCPLYKDSAKKQFRFHVVDKSHVQYMLLSNQLRSGEKDLNPLLKAVQRNLPDKIDHRLTVNFDNQIELIGVSMPRRVDRGSEFEMTLFYKILKPVTRPWKIFVHIDGPARINGDHTPVNGHCAMSYFQPGDYVIDRHTIKAGDITYPKTSYQVWTGFFVGSGGPSNNMKPLSGDPDKDSRVPIGHLELR
jgi:hypothetical protein